MSALPPPDTAPAARRATALRGVAAHTAPGTTQPDRLPPALQGEGAFAPDERSLADWVALLAGHARHLRLPSLDEAAAPDDARWSVLFEQDEALLLALLASAQGDPATRALHQPGDSGSPPSLQAELARLAAALDHAARRLARCDGDAAQALRQRLLAQQPRLDAARAAAAAGPARLVAPGSPGSATPFPADPAAAAQARHAALQQAVALHRTVLAQLRDMAREQLPASLDSGRHDAAPALLLAALQAGAVVQQHANGFTRRLVQTYVDDVLGLRPRPAQPERWVAVARREPGAPADAILPAGTRFSAGKDAAGRDIVLRTQAPAQVDATRVAALHTLRLVRDRTISPEHELGYVCRARCQALPLGPPADDPARPGESGVLPAWPLFGGEELPAAGAGAQDARFGLALASPLLLLEEGERTLRVTLTLTHVATADVRLQALAHTHAQQLHDADAAGAAQTLDALFRGYARLERRRPAQGLPPVDLLVAQATPRLAALPADARTPLAHYRCFLLLRTLHARGAGLRFAAGRLFVHWLLAPGGDGPDWLLDAPADRAALGAAARAAMPDAATRAGRTDSAAGAAQAAGPGGRGLAEDDALALFLQPEGAPRPERALLFAQLFGNLFAARVSTPQGWHAISEVHVLRPPPAAPNGSAVQGVALQVVLSLPAGEPPVVPLDPALHGAGWDTRLPVLQLLLRASGGVYPYAMLESAQLLTVDLHVAVAGLRQVSLHNQIGPLDPGRPFQPFGPLPAVGQHLVLGARELACKPLTALTLHLRWSGLPVGPGGFAAHYAGWPAPPQDGSFRVVPAVLRDGQWVSAAGPAPAPSATMSVQGRGEVPLFASAGPDAGLAPTSRIVLDPRLLLHHHQPLAGPLPDAAPVFDIGARQALFRLQLTQPAGAFGHADHAAVLTEAVQANARRRLRTPQPLPRAPYTPTLEGLTLDYAAGTRIHVGRADAAAAADPHAARVFHLHPFGIACVHPQPQAGAARLLPPVLHDGTLFIGLSAPVPPRRVALLFHLHAASAAAGQTPPPAPRWHALAGDRWQPLAPTQVLADGTGGFLGTGIVELELPDGIDTDHRLMPAGLYWLALGADGGFARFAGLHGVHAQALLLERETAGPDTPAPAGAPTAALPALPPLRPLRPVPGLAGVQTLALARAAAPAETPQQLLTRAGERLRHRQRAVLPWDYERLLLAHFPDVAQAKCFSAAALAPALGAAAAGRVLVAVLPGAQRFDRAGGQLAPRISAAELAAMQRLLQDLAPPGVQVWVRHAVYEWVQLRCRVRLQPGVAEGATLRACERAVFERLNPWLPGALPARFGWALRAEVLESALRAVPGVAHVTGLSLLKLVRDDDGRHRLADTARGTDDATRDRAELRPDLPWSVAVPMERHLITPTPQAQGHAPVPTGIAQLAVGRNFVIGRRDG